MNVTHVETWLDFAQSKAIFESQVEPNLRIVDVLDCLESRLKLLFVDAVHDQSLLVVVEFFRQHQAVIVDPPVRLQQLEDGAFVQVVDLLLNEGKELVLHFSDAVLEHLVFLQHRLVLCVFQHIEFDFKEHGGKHGTLSPLFIEQSMAGLLN